MSNAVLRALALLAAPLSACRGELNRYVDEGDLCLVPHEGDGADAGVARLLSDRMIEVEVSVTDCLSSSCDVDRSFECRVQVEGDEIRVRSTLQWRTRGRECTADCGLAVARCEVPALAAGTYRIVHGDTTTMITVPGDTAACAREF